MERSGEVEPAPPPVRRIEFEADWHPGHVAAYLVEADEPVLVDAGNPWPGATAELREGLAAHGYDLGDVEHLLLTHAHPDHVGQAPTVVEAADPTVYAPELVTERLGRDLDARREAVRANAVAAGVAGDRLGSVVEWGVQTVEMSRQVLPEVDVEIAHGATVDVGGVSVEAVHTPGHNLEHLCYLAGLDGERVLFSGDMAIRTFRAVLMHVGLDDGVDAAVPEFQRALGRLGALDVDRVHPGHGPVHDEFDAALEQSRASLGRLLDATRDHLDAFDTAVGITRDRMDDGGGDGTSPERDVTADPDGDARRDGMDAARALGYMLPETVAALAHLGRTGRARSTTDDRGVRRYEPS